LCGSRSFMRIFNTMSVPNLGQLRWKRSWK
jgi:hypothetical protein